MAHIQITDLNPSDSGLIEELTEEELLEINGGFGWVTWLGSPSKGGIGYVTTPVVIDAVLKGRVTKLIQKGLSWW